MSEPIAASGSDAAISGGGCAADPSSNAASFPEAQSSLTLHPLEKLDALVARKLRRGFARDCVDKLAELLRRIGHGEGDLSRLKYLVFDFAHQGEGRAEAADGYEELASANAELILHAPVISIAWARGFMVGADLDFALSSSMIIAERGARFSFEIDPSASIGVYGSLAQKIGFVKAERLMEKGVVLGAEEMCDLLLAKQVADQEPGLEGVERYVDKSSRRYNASYSLFRAQRIATPPASRQWGVAPATERRS